MPHFKERSYRKELLDADNIPFEDIQQNMKELDSINRFLGGHRITIKGLEAMLKNAPAHTVLHIAEIGCGGGDNLRVIKTWAKSKGIKTKLSGFDINPACIQFAQNQNNNEDINFICADYKELSFLEKPHIIFSSLFCHHFKHDEVVFMLRWMQQKSAIGFFINDLHRHPVAYYTIIWLTRIFSKSYLVKNDAPLSVLRGFRKKEWEKLLKEAGIMGYSIRWQWAFRWLVIHPA